MENQITCYSLWPDAVEPSGEHPKHGPPCAPLPRPRGGGRGSTSGSGGGLSTSGDTVTPVREPHLTLVRMVPRRPVDSPAYLLDGFAIASWLREAAERATAAKTEHISVSPGLARRIADHLDNVERRS